VKFQIDHAFIAKRVCNRPIAVRAFAVSPAYQRKSAHVVCSSADERRGQFPWIAIGEWHRRLHGEFSGPEGTPLAAFAEKLRRRGQPNGWQLTGQSLLSTLLIS
jgi:hypothetical protein